MFSDIAKKHMTARFSDSDFKVGTTYVKNNPWGDFSKFTQTDCITFVINVLKDTYSEIGKASVVKSLISNSLIKRGKDRNPKFYGDMLARILVQKHAWSAIYLTPDRFHPNDAKKEHSFATSQVLRKCQYTGVPVSYIAMDYNPTSKNDPAFQALLPFKERPFNVIALSELKKIKFAYGISRKGDHTSFL